MESGLHENQQQLINFDEDMEDIEHKTEITPETKQESSTTDTTCN